MKCLSHWFQTLDICAACLCMTLTWSSAVPADSTTDQNILDMQQQLDRLNKVNFHPNLLPVILRNSDFMGLTDEQIAAFKAWGETNFKPMVAVMNEIIHERIEFEEAALSPAVSADDLRNKQDEIFRLHRKLLDYKLSCSENIVQTFSEENWEGFLLVLGEEGFPIPGRAAASEFATLSGKPDDAGTE